MMDMREFQEKLEQLMELAAKQEKNLNNEQILEVFGLNQLSPQQLQSLYEYLRIQGIRIQEPDLITGRAYDLPVLCLILPRCIDIRSEPCGQQDSDEYQHTKLIC